MFINNFDPVAIELFSFEIRWYSLSYIIGIILGWFLAKKIFISNQEIKDKFDDYITYVILGIIFGGRIGYVLIYDLYYYINNPIDILKIWQGGMSFHGGLLGIIFVSIFYAQNNKQNPLRYLDVVALVSPIGIFFGRISNFINSELYGIETNLPWAVKFIKIDNLYRHPSQLYEAAFEGIFLFIILVYFKRKGFLKFPGMISGIFLTFYSLFRFIIEFVRVPDDQLGYLMLNLTMGQIISLIFFIIGIYLITTKYETESKV
tara:strand:+ start:5035 stop:5817 length:783 start_codon:yes stop_codon:yes gene_type:complete